MTTYRSKNGLTIESSLTQAECLALLTRQGGEFALKLIANCNERYLYGVQRGQLRGLTESQWAWAHKIALEQQAREQAAAAAQAVKNCEACGIQHQAAEAACPACGNGRPVQAVQPAAEFGAVMALFTNATASGRKFPKLRFVMEGKVIVLSLCGSKSKTPGSVNVTDDRKYPDNAWYGRIGQDGVFHLSARTRPETPVVLAFLRRLAGDPVAAAARYGHESGECCFCGKELTVSTVGYGPDCARVWGLPYDSITQQAARRGRSGRAARGIAAEAAAQRAAAAPVQYGAPVVTAGDVARNGGIEADLYGDEDPALYNELVAEDAAERADELAAEAVRPNADGSWSPAALLAALRNR